MKRLAFCFDGTWDRLDAPAPTNVVLTAQSISPIAKDGTTQIIHYDQGVGTAKGSKWSGGLFGIGLLDNIVRAYTFLIFNYEPGDEIYVLGFSRGAYTARSFVGLLRTVGILPRSDAGRIAEAVERYKSREAGEDHDSEELLRYRLKASPRICVDSAEDAWRRINDPNYKSGSCPVLQISYLGVWDTVGSLGIPNTMLIAPLANRKVQFYDTELSDLVLNARHAIAIDEKRKSFTPTLWTNIDALNAARGFASADAEAPYQQKWFPGTHGSVGGGGPERGLSDFSLDWVMRGARITGLQLDTQSDSRAFSLRPNPFAPLENFKDSKKSIVSFLMKLLPKSDRVPGPYELSDVSRSAAFRWAQPANQLPEKKLYRPQTLSNVGEELDRAASNAQTQIGPQYTPGQPTPLTPTPGAFYKIVQGDTLSGIAQKAYGATSQVTLIEAANPTLLDGPDEIYIDQILYIPRAS